MARIADVGHLAGVTPSVVSRVLNEDPTLRVREETRQRVLAAARKLDYTPNHAARALRRSRVGALGLAVHDISNPVYAPLIAGAQEAATRTGYVLMLADVSELARGEATFRRVVGSGSIDGLLLLPAGVGADRAVERAVSGRLPIVVVNERSRTSPSIGLPDRQAMKVATRHLLGLGHREVALLRLDGRGHRARERTAGYKEALSEHGIEPDPSLVVTGGHTAETGRNSMARLLRRGDGEPSAVVSASVLAAVGALGAAHAAGVEVPGQLSIIGCHDVFFAPYLSPPLTVVRLGLRELGRAAVERLLAQLDLPGTGHDVVAEPAPAVVARGTTSPPVASGNGAVTVRVGVR
jgi:LacI family transcriptional regulator